MLRVDVPFAVHSLQDPAEAAREKGDLKTAARLLDSLCKLTGAFEEHNHQKHGIKSEAEAEAIRDKLKQRGMNFDVVNAPSPN